MDLIKFEKDFEGRLTEFSFNGKNIRLLFDNENNPWFVGKDVALVLEYKNTKYAISTHVDDDCKCCFGYFKGKDSYTLHKQTILISEPGLYALICNSKMELAKKFRKWVYNDVLVKLRKYGEYKIIRDHKKEIKVKDDKIDSLEYKIEQMRLEFRSSFKALEEKHDQTHSKLNFMNHKLDIVTDHTPITVDNVFLEQSFVILKLNDPNDEFDYYGIRTQEKNIDKSIKRIQKKYRQSTVLIKIKSEPNPIRFYIGFLDELRMNYPNDFVKRNNKFRIRCLDDCELKRQAQAFDKIQRKEMANNFDKRIGY